MNIKFNSFGNNDLYWAELKKQYEEIIETIKRLEQMQQECNAHKSELKDIKDELQSREKCSN